MFDLDGIMDRARRAQEAASAQLEASMEKSRKLLEQQKESLHQGGEDPSAESGQPREVEILGQLLGPDGLRQTAEAEARMQAEVERQMAGYAAMSADEMLSKLLGDDMGIVAAALETLAEEEGLEPDEDDDGLSQEELCVRLEARLAQVEALPERPPVPYGDSGELWQCFGILLSGIVSRLNQHGLSGLDVEEHVPVMEQQIATLVRNTWGIRGREGLLDKLQELTQAGHRQRYRDCAQAESIEALEEAEWADRETIRRCWTFAQRYRESYPPEALLGWDLGRAAMITRWGCYLGWITRREAEGILSDLSQAAADGLGSWREFGCSYLFGGVFWKLLCGAEDGGSYLNALTDAVEDLLGSGGDEDGMGQWRDCPWPVAAR